MLLNALQDVPNLKTLNLSACCLTSRSVGSLSLFLKKRNANISENVWKDLNTEERRKKVSACFILRLKFLTVQ